MNKKIAFFFVFALLASGVLAHEEKESPVRAISACNKKRACVVEPEVTEGPYYYDTSLVRDDITEGKTGVQLNLTITVLNLATCLPIANAAVDIWHCDASGVYSHFVNDQNPAPANSTYLRGIVLTNSSGVASMKTIYPGWYTGRTTHIHMKIHINGTDTNGIYSGGSVTLTSQLFLNDSVSDVIYGSSLYDGEPSTGRITNSEDDIYGQMSGMGLLDVEAFNSASGYLSGVNGFITIVVDTASSTSGSSSGSTSGSSSGGSGTSASPSPSTGASASPSPAVDSDTSGETQESQATKVAVSALILAAAMLNL